MSVRLSELWVAANRVGFGHFGLYIELDEPMALLDGRNLYRFFHDDPERAFGTDPPGLYFACEAPPPRRGRT